MTFKTLLLGSLLALTGCVTISYETDGSEAYKGKPRPWPMAAQCPPPASARADAQAVLALINAERTKAGVPPVALSSAATGVAQAFACENGARHDISHEGTDGSSLGERLKRGGIRPSVMAENVAFGMTSPQEVMTAWMNSPGHRRNILRPEVKEIGVGKAEGGYVAWVLDLYAN